jgi:hypothetical protein
MAGYPKVDRGNPYLVAAFTGHVVDSLPWGRGWMAGQVGGGGGGGYGGLASVRVGETCLLAWLFGRAGCKQ